MSTSIDDLAQRALQAYSSGQRAAAEQLSRELAGRQPLHPTLAYLSGAFALESQQHVQAVLHFHHATLLAPQEANYHHALGEALRTSGQPRSAVESYHTALRLDPRRAGSNVGLGLTLRDLDQKSEAEVAFRKAIELDPGLARAHLNLGQALLDRGEIVEAIGCFQEAVRLHANYDLAHNNLGVARQAQGQHDAAIEHLRTALKIRPDYPEAHFNLGVSLLALGDASEALRELSEALRLRPNYVRARIKLGEALAHQNRLADAITAGKSAVQLDPQSVEAWEALGHLHSRAEDWGGARDAFDRLLALKPDHPSAFAFAFRMRELLCDWRTREPDLQRLLADTERSLADGKPPALTPFHTLSIPCSAKLQCQVAVAHAAVLDKQIDARRRSLNFTFSRTRPARLRIGYLSADFHCHATVQLMLSLFGLHDRAGFEIFGYSYGPDDGSEYRKRIVRDCDHFIDLAPLNYLESAKRIHADGIHILVDLKGPTGLSRQEIAALRPAPIQVHYLGYPGTTGAPWIDYFLGDPVASPPELFAGAFHEKLAVLPHCYQVNDHQQPIADKEYTRAECDLPSQGFVFCCFNNSYKLEPRMFTIWMRILKEVPGSVLWLLARHPEVAGNLRRTAAQQGVDPARLIFASAIEKSLHLARHRLVGLFLDTLEYNAHTTASDALWAGVPLITCPGSTFASRVATSLLTAIELPELIVPDLESYERLAIQFATRPKALDDLRKKLERQRTTTPLFDTPQFARDLERAYRAMWERYELGKGAELIDSLSLKS